MRIVRRGGRLTAAMCQTCRPPYLGGLIGLGRHVGELQARDGRS